MVTRQFGRIVPQQPRMNLSLWAGMHSHHCTRCGQEYTCPAPHTDAQPVPAKPWHQLCDGCRAAYEAVADDREARQQFQADLRG